MERRIGCAVLGYGVATNNIVAGLTNATLSSVLAKLAVSLTPSTIHTGMDAYCGVIVGSGYIDANGNAVSINLDQDNYLFSPFTFDQPFYECVEARTSKQVSGRRNRILPWTRCRWSSR